MFGLRKMAVLSVLLVVLCSPSYGQSVPLVTGEWPPFVSEKMDGYGLAGKLVSAVFEEMGLVPETSFVPWKRCEDMVKKGEAWGTFPYAITDERKAEFLFSDPFMESISVFFSLKDVSFDDLSDLSGLSVGGVRGTFYEPLFAEAGLNIDWSSDDETMIKKLMAGRIDLAPVVDVVGWTIINRDYSDMKDQVIVLKKTLQSTESAMMVSKAYPGAQELIDKFNLALESIRQKGIYDDIMALYGAGK